MNVSIWNKKKQKGPPMTCVFFLASMASGFGTAVLAHPGAHFHPHDGAHWLTLVSALAVLALAGGLALVRGRSRR